MCEWPFQDWFAWPRSLADDKDIADYGATRHRGGLHAGATPASKELFNVTIEPGLLLIALRHFESAGDSQHLSLKSHDLPRTAGACGVLSAFRRAYRRNSETIKLKTML